MSHASPPAGLGQATFSASPAVVSPTHCLRLPTRTRGCRLLIVVAPMRYLLLHLQRRVGDLKTASTKSRIAGSAE